MGKGELTRTEVNNLIKNPYVIMVRDNKYIKYSEEFRQLFKEEYLKGKGPTQIFREAGFDVAALGNKRIERASDRMRPLGAPKERIPFTITKLFTEEEREFLSKNPYVKDVTEREIHYTEEYKKHFIRRSLERPRCSAKQIFEEAGFDVILLGDARINKAKERWMGLYKKGKITV